MSPSPHHQQTVVAAAVGQTAGEGAGADVAEPTAQGAVRPPALPPSR